MKRNTILQCILATLLASLMAVFPMGAAFAGGGSVESGGYEYHPKIKITQAGDTVTPPNVLKLNQNTTLCLNADAPVNACSHIIRSYSPSTAIQIQGGIVHTSTLGISSSGPFSSSVASGSAAFSCTNVGCRLSLGNSSRYLYDNTAGIALLSGNFVADQGNIQSSNGSFVTSSGIYNYAANSPLSVRGNASDGATAIGVQIANLNALSTAGAKVASFYSDNKTTEVASVGAEGTITSKAASSAYGFKNFTEGAYVGIGPNANQYLYSDSSYEVHTPGRFRADTSITTQKVLTPVIEGTNPGGTTLAINGCNDGCTSSTNPAVYVRPSAALTADDLVFAAQNFGGSTNLFTVDYEGDVQSAGTITTPSAKNIISGGAVYAAGVVYHGASGAFRANTTTAATLLSSLRTSASTTATSPAIAISPANSLDSTDLILAVQQNDGTNVATFTYQGAATFNSNVTADSVIIANSAGQIKDSGATARIGIANLASTTLVGEVSDAAGNIANKFGNANALTNARAEIASFYSDNLSTKVAKIYSDGSYSFAGIASGSLPTCGGAGGVSAGTLQYATDLAVMAYCDGTTWTPLATGAGWQNTFNAWFPGVSLSSTTPFAASRPSKDGGSIGQLTFTTVIAGVGAGQSFTLQLYDSTAASSVCTRDIACDAAAGTETTNNCSSATITGGHLYEYRISSNSCDTLPSGNVSLDYAAG